MTTNFGTETKDVTTFPDVVRTKTNDVSKISWAEFEKKYLHREDGYKYEWLDGVVEKTKQNMEESQFFILRNLQKLLQNLIAEGLADGEFIQEGDLFFLSHHRKPDIAYLSGKQIDLSAYGEKQVPYFVIEIISTNDGINRVNRKMQDYRAAGVQVVWNIFPMTEEVHVYYGENLDQVNIKRGEKICSAAPVLPDFALNAAEIFQKPEKPN